MGKEGGEECGEECRREAEDMEGMRKRREGCEQRNIGYWGDEAYELKQNIYDRKKKK